jgi:murein DD-endopeptidase MepM/ murein hydrolase activator NlpD
MLMTERKVQPFRLVQKLLLRPHRAIVSASLLFAITAGAAHAAQDCGNGVELRLSSLAPSQGTLLLAEVHSVAPIAEVQGEWDSRAILFWQSDSYGKIWRALLGADIDKAAGDYSFKVSLQSSNGDPVTCTATIAVKEGHFPTENLHVENKFVEPDPEQLARAKEEGERLREIFDRVTPERVWQGRFRLPLDGVTTGGNFGRRRVLNGQPGSPHTGVDFPSPAGTPVHAAQRGRVVLAESLYFPGNTVILDHGLGIYTLYGHLSEISVKVGDLVDRGALLGKVGATGRVTGPHLHWGLTVNKARVNALQIVKLLPE